MDLLSDDLDIAGDVEVGEGRFEKLVADGDGGGDGFGGGGGEEWCLRVKGALENFD